MQEFYLKKNLTPKKVKSLTDNTMRKLIYLLLFLLTLLSYSQKKSVSLKPIKENYSRINAIKKWTKVDKKEVVESTEGGEILFFYLNDKLGKIAEIHFGEMRKTITEYYLLNGKLSFYLDVEVQYEKPFDDKNSTKLTDRKYFKNNKLIHEINEQDQGSPFINNKLAIAEEEKRILANFDKILHLAKKQL